MENINVYDDMYFIYEYIVERVCECETDDILLRVKTSHFHLAISACWFLYPLYNAFIRQEMDALNKEGIKDALNKMQKRGKQRVLFLLAILNVVNWNKNI